MPNSHEIELFISEDGEIKVHIKGMKGPECLKVLDSLAKEIGEVKNKDLTGEYYEKPLTQNNTNTKIRHD
ncbi:MAG: DUF2997 domain-containing protein [Candidatus Omnitrophota bacterium]